MIRLGLFFLLSIVAFAFVEPSIKQVPTGFVRISFYRYMQQHETTFKEWREFMGYMEKEKGDRPERYGPDFTQIALDWKTKKNLEKMFQAGNLDSLAVVGVRFEDVMKFVAYKNELEQAANKKETEFKRLKYLLPNSETDTLLGKMGALLSGTKSQKNLPNAFPVLPINHPMGSTKSKLFFIHQNVSEMSDTKGIALRGSYKKDLKSSGLGVVQNYFVPSGFIGFRLMAEVVEE
jgi:hypothetical protein